MHWDSSCCYGGGIGGPQPLSTMSRAGHGGRRAIDLRKQHVWRLLHLRVDAGVRTRGPEAMGQPGLGQLCGVAAAEPGLRGSKGLDAKKKQNQIRIMEIQAGAKCRGVGDGLRLELDEGCAERRDPTGVLPGPGRAGLGGLPTQGDPRWLILGPPACWAVEKEDLHGGGGVGIPQCTRPRVQCAGPTG